MQKKTLIIAIAGICVLAVIVGALFFSMLDDDGDKEASPAQSSESIEAREAVEENESDSSRQAEEREADKEPGQETQTTAPRVPAKKDVTVAWQPSHQDDTDDASWHEYQTCGDIVDRAIQLCTMVDNAKCWDITHGLTGTNRYDPQPTNTPAFDNEVAMANQAQADYFISVHNDGGAPSGILGLCMPGDALSRSYLEQSIRALCASTGLPNWGIWEVRLYSLEPERNSCPVRFLLEIGDNVKDRDKLMNPEFRQLVAQTLANFVNSLPSQR